MRLPVKYDNKLWRVRQPRAIQPQVVEGVNAPAIRRKVVEGAIARAIRPQVVERVTVRAI